MTEAFVNEYEMSYPEDSANMPLSNERTWHPDIEDFPYMGHGNVQGGGGRWQGAEVPVPPNANLYYGARLPDDSANMPLDEKNAHADIDDFPYMGSGNVQGGGGRWQGAEVPVPPNANLYYGAGLKATIAPYAIPVLTYGTIAIIIYTVYRNFFKGKDAKSAWAEFLKQAEAGMLGTVGFLMVVGLIVGVKRWLGGASFGDIFGSMKQTFVTSTGISQI